MRQPVVRRTWAPKGQTPIHYSWDRRDRLSAISAVTVSSTHRRLQLYFDIHDHNIDTDTFQSFVRWPRHQIRRGIILVVHRWPVYRSCVLRLPVWLEACVCPNIDVVLRTWQSAHSVAYRGL